MRWKMGCSLGPSRSGGGHPARGRCGSPLKHSLEGHRFGSRKKGLCVNISHHCACRNIMQTCAWTSPDPLTSAPELPLRNALECHDVSGSRFRLDPVALSADLPPASVLPARLASASLAVWRAQGGAVLAVADRCPHRGMRLSHGFVRGEALSCIYHGWRYGKSGRCLAIPAHPGLEPPEAIRVAIYRTEERDGIIG